MKLLLECVLKPDRETAAECRASDARTANKPYRDEIRRVSLTKQRAARHPQTATGRFRTHS